LIQLVNGDTNHLQIINSSDPAPADYYWVSNGWSLVTGNGLKNETLTVNTVGSLTTKVRTIRNIVGGTDYQSTETWQNFPYGNRLIQKTIGSGPMAQTESSTYTADGMIQQANHSDGSWDIYVYDSLDRQIGHYSSFLNCAPTTNAALCRYTASTYDNSVVNNSGDCGNLEPCTPRRIINYVQGTEVSRSYTVVKMGEFDDIQCVNPGAAWNDPGNLVTVTHTYVDAVNLGQPAQILRPDGTIQMFAYDTGVTAPLHNADF
jgi:hypothetical protein